MKTKVLIVILILMFPIISFGKQRIFKKAGEFSVFVENYNPEDRASLINGLNTIKVIRMKNLIFPDSIRKYVDQLGGRSLSESDIKFLISKHRVSSKKEKWNILSVLNPPLIGLEKNREYSFFRYHHGGYLPCEHFKNAELYSFKKKVYLYDFLYDHRYDDIYVLYVDNDLNFYSKTDSLVRVADSIKIEDKKHFFKNVGEFSVFIENYNPDNVHSLANGLNTIKILKMKSVYVNNEFLKKELDSLGARSLSAFDLYFLKKQYTESLPKLDIRYTLFSYLKKKKLYPGNFCMDHTDDNDYVLCVIPGDNENYFAKEDSFFIARDSIALVIKEQAAKKTRELEEQYSKKWIEYWGVREYYVKWLYGRDCLTYCPTENELLFGKVLKEICLLDPDVHVYVENGQHNYSLLQSYKTSQGVLDVIEIDREISRTDCNITGGSYSREVGQVNWTKSFIKGFFAPLTHADRKLVYDYETVYEDDSEIEYIKVILGYKKSTFYILNDTLICYKEQKKVNDDLKIWITVLGESYCSPGKILINSSGDNWSDIDDNWSDNDEKAINLAKKKFLSEKRNALYCRGLIQNEALSFVKSEDKKYDKVKEVQILQGINSFSKKCIEIDTKLKNKKAEDIKYHDIF
jgi:hypothetical protein